MDYEPLTNFILNFDRCQFKSCTTVTIIDDLIDEPVESFNATLNRSPGLDVRITLSPVEAVIEIDDNDGICFIVTSPPPLSLVPIIVGYERMVHTVTETEGIVELISVISFH